MTGHARKNTGTNMLRSKLDVSVRRDDRMVVRAAEGLDALTVGHTVSCTMCATGEEPTKEIASMPGW